MTNSNSNAFKYKYNIGKTTQKEVRKSKKNVKTLLNNTKNKRIDNKIKSTSKKRYSIFAKNRKLSQLDNFPEEKTNKTNKTRKSKSNNKITKYLDRIRSSRIKEYNKNRKPLDYLKMICSDTGVCIAFGIETMRIRRFFDDFENFNHVANMTNINPGSVNGNIYEIKYELDNYVAYAILKNSQNIHSDNVIYEYLVGLFINTKHMIYPCFLETYEMYTSNGISLNTITDLKQMIPYKNIHYNPIDLVCNTQNEFTLLIQHIKDATTLYECLHRIDTSFYEFEIFFVLFQIYHTLSELKDQFTHYDLHYENVLLYEPVNGSYIQYNYEIKGKKINFKSKYIVKIIDYGKCFFKNTKNKTSSMDVRNYICSIPNCNCGKTIGFNSITDDTDFCIYNDICSYKNNISHDLRLLSMLNKFAVNEALRNITQKVIYAGVYGTPEITTSGLGLPDKKIHNIIDAFSVILETITTIPEIIQKNNDYYQNSTLLGNLYVYGGNTKTLFTKVK